MHLLELAVAERLRELEGPDGPWKEAGTLLFALVRREGVCLLAASVEAPAVLEVVLPPEQTALRRPAPLELDRQRASEDLRLELRVERGSVKASIQAPARQSRAARARTDAPPRQMQPGTGPRADWWSNLARLREARSGGALVRGFCLYEMPATFGKRRTAPTWRCCFHVVVETRTTSDRVVYEDPNEARRTCDADKPYIFVPSSRAHAQLSDAQLLSGEWIKTRGADAVTRMPFLARITEAERATDFLPMRFEERPAVPGGTRPALASRYEVQFESSRDPAIGEFHLLAEPEDPAAPRGVLGTFLTTTGDYRYLAGSIDAQGLRLSCFDGAHAFLFHAEQVPGRQVHGGLATLRGDFWSRESWHESWTAGPNASIQLPDPWAQVGLKPASERPDWRAIQVTQLDGMRVPLGKLGSQDAPARLLVLFGSWCPNCHDEHAYLKELYQKYAARGLAITSLGFELGGERGGQNPFSQRGHHTTGHKNITRHRTPSALQASHRNRESITKVLGEMELQDSKSAP